jgi:HD-GYP domain-containing protein (c-di-GMP phosphodiesterase class II)
MQFTAAVDCKRRKRDFEMKDIKRQGNEQDGGMTSLRENDDHATLCALAATLRIRDAETQGHSERVVRFSLLLGHEFGLTPAQMRSLEYGSLLHDIGKIGVPDAILRKPGRLTADEWITMREHPLLGLQILSGIDFLESASLVVGQHHERWDGKGYPFGLRGDEIDLNARIFAVADAFDAIISNRVYRAGKTFEAASSELRKSAGRQFDPEVVQAFSRIQQQEWKLVKLYPENSA